METFLLTLWQWVISFVGKRPRETQHWHCQRIHSTFLWNKNLSPVHILTTLLLDMMFVLTSILQTKTKEVNYYYIKLHTILIFKHVHWFRGFGIFHCFVLSYKQYTILHITLHCLKCLEPLLVLFSRHDTGSYRWKNVQLMSWLFSFESLLRFLSQT